MAARARSGLLLALMLALCSCQSSDGEAWGASAAEPSSSAVPAALAHHHREVHRRWPPDLPEEREDVRSWCRRSDHDCVVYVPTPQKVVDQMLDVAKLQSSDVLYDLGCGDGRILVTAAKKYGVHAFGFDINPERVSEARD